MVVQLFPDRSFNQGSNTSGAVVYNQHVSFTFARPTTDPTPSTSQGEETTRGWKGFHTLLEFHDDLRYNIRRNEYKPICPTAEPTSSTAARVLPRFTASRHQAYLAYRYNKRQVSLLPILQTSRQKPAPSVIHTCQNRRTYPVM